MAYWSPANIRTLTDLWEQGKSASEIANALPREKFSRNAVIGKAWRLGLSRRPSPLPNQKKGANIGEE